MLSGGDDGVGPVRPRQLRSGEQSIVGGAMSVISLIIGIAVIVGVKDADGSHPTSALILGSVIVFGAGVLARSALSCVRTSSTGLTVINPFRTRRIAWRDIDRFSLGRSGIYPRIGQAHLNDQRVVRLWAIQGVDPTTRHKNRKAEALITELNETLKAVS